MFFYEANTHKLRYRMGSFLRNREILRDLFRQIRRERGHRRLRSLMRKDQATNLNADMAIYRYRSLLWEEVNKKGYTYKVGY